MRVQRDRRRPATDARLFHGQSLVGLGSANKAKAGADGEHDASGQPSAAGGSAGNAAPLTLRGIPPADLVVIAADDFPDLALRA